MKVQLWMQGYSLEADLHIGQDEIRLLKKAQVISKKTRQE